jgi:hypothetical protein
VEYAGRRSANPDEAPIMSNDRQINFDAPAALRKWPSIKNERVSAADGGCPYLIVDGTLDECIREFMAKPASQHHLYEIHTIPQGELVTAVLAARHIFEISRLRISKPKSKSLPVLADRDKQ